jgi:hypothetical protein
MLIAKDFPRTAPTPITFEARALIAELRAGPMLLTWYDPAQKAPVIMPIGDARAVRPDTKVYQVSGEYEVAVLMATKQLLDEGDEAGAYSCLSEIADENQRRH